MVARPTAARLIEGWGEQTAVAVAGRHVLAVHDTSEFNFSTTPKRRRGLGKIGKGGGRGVLLHAMLALDAGTGGCLGLVAGRIWTRRGRVKVAHQKRRTENKESHRWIATAEQSKRVLAAAAQVTVVADRESDIFAQWATTPEPGFHLISRVMHDRRLATGEDLYAAAERFAFTAKRLVALPEREQKRKARPAWLSLRFGTVELARPRKTRDLNLPQSVSLTLVEVVERDAPTGTEAVHWRLLTTHEVNDAAAAWQIVDWYKMRWTIEQFWRLLKLQGLRVEEARSKPPSGSSSSPPSPPRPRSPPCNSCRPAAPPIANPPPSPSAQTRSPCSTNSTPNSKARQNCRRTPIETKASNGHVGSSPSSAAGTATRRPSRRGQSPSNTVSKNSMLS